MLRKTPQILKQFGLIALICILGIILEYSAHDIFNNFSIRPDYVSFSLFLGPFWAFLVFRVFKRYFKPYWVFAIVVAMNEMFLLDAGLSAKHYFAGFNYFVILSFMALHFLMFLAPAWFIFKYFYNIFGLKIPVSFVKESRAQKSF